LPGVVLGQKIEDVGPRIAFHHANHGLFGEDRVARRWDPEQFFDDKQSIALIRSIVAGDVQKINLHIENGVDVNCLGESGMNPLFWAWHLGDSNVFECLLEHGADPNLQVDIRGSSATGVFPGKYAVVHLVSRGRCPRCFRLVFDNGGDPNMFCQFSNPATPFLMLMTDLDDGMARFDQLTKRGANINENGRNGETMLFTLVTWPSEIHFDMAMKLLKAGADTEVDYWRTAFYWRREWDGCHLRLIHVLALMKDQVAKLDNAAVKKFNAIVDFVEAKGESLDDAVMELDRWKRLLKDKKKSQIEKEWLENAIEEAETTGDSKAKTRWGHSLFHLVTRPSEARLKLAKKLIELGANHETVYSRQMALWRPDWSEFDVRLIHIAIELAEQSEKYPVGASKGQFLHLIDALEAKGESKTDAKSELKQWKKQLRSPKTR
jgi:hypothetical protein